MRGKLAVIALTLLLGGIVVGSSSAATNTLTNTMLAPYAGSGDYILCSGGVVTPDNPVTPAKEQTCTISSNSGACIERSSARVVVQTCDFTQTSAASTNRAIAIQLAIQRKSGPSGLFDATQIVHVGQQNVTANNNALVGQAVIQALGRSEDNGNDDDGDEEALAGSPVSAPINQNEEGHQYVVVCQGGADCHSAAGMTGDNTSNLLQVLGQSEVGKGAPTINQLQNVALRPTQCPNVEDLSAHVCASVDQNTTAGRDVSRIAQPYREFQSARNTGGGQQVQGDTTDPAKAGGLDHVVNQVGAQKSDIFTGQNAVQLQLTRNVGTMTQFQDPPIRKGLGSTQTATADSTWTGVQRLVQIQRMDGVSMGNQTALESYECFTTGLCTVNQSVNQNGAVTTNSCGPTSFCQTEITCEAVSEESGGCVAPPPVTSCSEGTFFDPTTGQCEEEIE